MASKRKNSLVENINRRKRAGKSRPKSRSTVSKESYEQMEQGWPKSGKKKAESRKRASARKSGGVKKKGTSSKRASARKSSGVKKAAKKK